MKYRHTLNALRSHLACTLLVLGTITLSNSIYAQEHTTMPAPKVIIFDVNETLLDLAPLRSSVGQALQGREDLLPLWFSTMLHYSLVDTLSNDYHDFGQIGAAALMMFAEAQTFKPDARTYEWVLEELGVAPEEVLMVAAHAWDLAGAKAVGLQTAFIQRPGTVLYPLTARPDYVVQNLAQLLDQLK